MKMWTKLFEYLQKHPKVRTFGGTGLYVLASMSTVLLPHKSAWMALPPVLIAIYGIWRYADGSFSKFDSLDSLIEEQNKVIGKLTAALKTRNDALSKHAQANQQWAALVQEGRVEIKGEDDEPHTVH